MLISASVRRHLMVKGHAALKALQQATGCSLRLQPPDKAARTPFLQLRLVGSPQAHLAALQQACNNHQHL